MAMVKISTVWDRTAEFLSDNIAQLVPLALIAFFVPSSIQANLGAAIESSGAQAANLLSLVDLALSILIVFGTLAVTAMSIDPLSEQSPGRVARSRLLPALVVLIGLLIGTIALALPILVTFVLNGVDLETMAAGGTVTLTPEAAAFVAIYLILLSVMLLWLAARMVVVVPVIVRERRWFGALVQSWKLTRGMTLRILGAIILFLLVAWVSYLAALTVFGSVFALVAGGDGEGVTLAGVLTSIVVGAVQAAFLVIATAFQGKLYVALISQAGFRGSAVPVA
jgi:hypothetical protein